MGQPWQGENARAPKTLCFRPIERDPCFNLFGLDKVSFSYSASSVTWIGNLIVGWEVGLEINGPIDW